MIATNCLLEEIWIVCVSLSIFLSARTFAISASFKRLSLFLCSLYSVSCILFMEVVTVLIYLMMFFHGSYGLSNCISSLSNCICMLSQTGILEDI